MEIYFLNEKWFWDHGDLKLLDQPHLKHHHVMIEKKGFARIRVELRFIKKVIQNNG